MADLSITDSAILPDSTGYEDVGTYVAGEAITPGLPIYLDSSNVAYIADANAVAKIGVIGLSMNTAATGQKVAVGKGRIAFGAIITAGVIYTLSNAVGGIRPCTDAASSGDYAVEIGCGASTTVMIVQPKSWGVAKS